MTSNPPDGQVPGASPAGTCKRPGCGSALPAQDRGRARQFCSTECARRYHNDARIPAPAAAPPSADSPADPLAALEGVARQAAVLIRAAREQAASLDPARVRAQVAEAEAARRRAEAAAVTAQARAAEAEAEAQALAEALEAAREDVRAAQTAAAAARREAEAAVAGLEQARREAASQIAAAQAGAAGQVSAVQAEAARCARERDDAIEAARRADAETVRARQAEADARAETEHVRADAARERDTLGNQHQAQLDAVAALTAAERTRAERAEQLLEAERADRRHLTSALTTPASPSNANGKLPRAAGGKAGQP
jgi:chromosome segregation ATPase